MTNQSNQNMTSLKIILGIGGILVILCGLAAVGLFYAFGPSYFEPKMQIVLEVDTTHVSVVNRAELEADARILTARCRALGCGASFTVENDQIIARASTSFDVESFAEQAIAIGLLELVDFGETPVSLGETIATDFGYEYFPSIEGTIWHTVMTNTDFKSAAVIRDQAGQYQVSFALTADGTKALSNYTTHNIDRYLGIVLDKVVLSAPIVRSPITDGMGVIAGSFTQDQAESLAAYLNVEGPLPVPLIIKDVIRFDR